MGSDWVRGWISVERDRPWPRKEECFRRFCRTLIHKFLKQVIALGAVIWEPVTAMCLVGDGT